MHLAMAAEWFPLLGLISTMAGILRRFGNVPPNAQFDVMVRLYAPAFTATGSGLFAALVNILPTWIVLVGRDLIRTLSGQAPAPASVESHNDRKSPRSGFAGRPPVRRGARARNASPQHGATLHPLMDVLILFFCIFLMMPAVKRTVEAEVGATTPSQEKQASLERREQAVKQKD